MEPVSDGRIQHASLSDAAFNEIRRRIISLQIEPGARLNIDKLAKELGVSPTPLREALNRLAAQKLIRVETYKGFAVEPLLDSGELVRLCAVRRLLESFAIESLGETLDRKLLAALRDDVDRMEKFANGRSFDGMVFNTMDRIFHERIVEAAGNAFLVDAYKGLNVHVQIARLFQQRAAKHALAANVEHRSMVEALARGDVKAGVDALKTHIDNGVARLVNLLKEREAARSAR